MKLDASLITFSVQVGSGGVEVARSVANRLGYRYYDWEVTSHAAEEAGVSPETLAAAERVPGFFERIFQRMAGAGLYVDDALIPLAPGSAMSFQAIRMLTSDEYRNLIERSVRELARQGEAVIVGHAGQVILRDEPAAFKVLVHASPAQRVRRLAADERMAPEQAEILVRESDSIRDRFFRHFYRVDHLDARLYDLALDMDRLDAKVATDLVVQAACSLRSAVPLPV